MNIWVICQYYKPEPGAPSARLSGLAKVWQKEGQNVSILTALPNHPKGELFPEYHGRGNFFDEDYEGVHVMRHWLYMTKNEGLIKKTLCHVSFAASVLLKHIFRKPAHKPDVIVVSSPSFFCVISAWLLSVRYRVPYVFEVRDLWPGIFVELGVLKEGFVLNMIEKLELFLYRRAAAVIAVTRGFAKNIVERGIDGNKVFVITNGVSDDEVDNGQRALTDGSVEKLRTEIQVNPLSKVVLYIGTHGGSQALGQVVDAARLLMARSDILFLFVGEGADKERLKKISRGMPNVQFLPSQPKEKMFAFYNMSYISLVTLKDVKGFDTFIPSKMFEIMASGTPMVGALRGEGAGIMEKSGGALVVPPEQPEKLAKAIMTLVDNTEKAESMGKAGMKFVSENYRHSYLGRQYLGILANVAKNHGNKTNA